MTDTLTDRSGRVIDIKRVPRRWHPDPSNFTDNQTGNVTITEE